MPGVSGSPRRLGPYSPPLSFPLTSSVGPHEDHPALGTTALQHRSDRRLQRREARSEDRASLLNVACLPIESLGSHPVLTADQDEATPLRQNATASVGQAQQIRPK